MSKQDGTILGAVKPNWQQGTIRDVVDPMDRNAIKPGPFGSSLTKNCYVENGFKVYGQEQVIAGSLAVGEYYVSEQKYRELFGFRIATNDLLISLVGTVGRILVVPASYSPGIINPRLLKISPDRSKASSRFLSYLLQSHLVQSQLEAASHGQTMAVLNARNLKRVSFLLPPLPEQRKIARILTIVDRLIEKTEALIAKYQAIKQGMMHDLFTRGVDEHGHLRPPYSEAPELYQASALGWIPKGWGIDEIGALGNVALGRQRAPKYETGPNLCPYLRVINISDDRLDIRDVKSMHFSDADYARYRLEDGDILVTEGDLVSALNVGRSVVYHGEVPRCCYQNTLIRFRPFESSYSDYFHFSFCHLRQTGKFAAVTAATTVHHLSSARIKTVRLAVAPPAERPRLTLPIRKLEHMIGFELEYRSKLVTKKSGLMQDLLTGRVRVKPDPEDFQAT